MWILYVGAVEVFQLNIHKKKFDFVKQANAEMSKWHNIWQKENGVS